jgi:hypothetical protein
MPAEFHAVLSVVCRIRPVGVTLPISSSDIVEQAFDVCIVGAGPAGLACAFACHDRGLRVLVLDAGAERPVPGTPDLLAAEFVNPKSHAPVEIAAASALGGSSHWWGGRSVPFDPVDFRGWPITYDEMVPWWRFAGEMLGCGSLVERAAPKNFSRLERFQAEGAESWAPDPNLGRHWRNRIRAPDGPAIVLGARVTGLKRTGAKITGVHVLTGDKPRLVKAGHIVLACGGLAGLRLMLIAQRADPALFGGPDGPLGRGYMGHMTGSIADLVPTNRADADAFGYFDVKRRYVARRRIMPRAETVIEEKIGNIAFWFTNPITADASHGSAGVSAKYIAAWTVAVLSGKKRGVHTPIGPHLENIRRHPIAAAYGLGYALWTLAATRFSRKGFRPKRFRSSGDGGWRLIYQSEQTSDPNNRVSLCDQTDSIGLPKLHIDFRFSEKDIDSVVRAHRLLDDDLRAAGAGSLRWTASIERRHAAVAAAATDGFHQLGGAVMNPDPAIGVVDTDCRAHGLENLWVVSGSVFPTGGQANPTLMIMGLACRAAERIAGLKKGAAREVASPAPRIELVALRAARSAAY